MKNICILFFLLIIFKAQGQDQLNATSWQEDLLELKKTINDDFPFLFHKITAEEFNKEVDEFYNEIPTLQQHEIVVGFSRIVALFKYGHTGIWFGEPFKFHHLPFNLYEFNDGIYLQGVHKDYPAALGAKLLKINNIPVDEALRMVYPVVSVENEQYFKAYGINHLHILEVLHAQGITEKLEDSVELTLSKDGETFTQIFTALTDGQGVPEEYGFTYENAEWLGARKQEGSPLYLKHLEKVYYFEHLEDEKAVYVRHSGIRNDPSESTEDFYKRVFNYVEENDVQKLILDVRLNGGGDNSLNKTIVQGIMRSSKLQDVGSLYVIIGRRTFSACQNLVNQLDNYTNCVFVGEGTAENINFWGDSQRITLSNSKLPVYLSYAWWQDKAAWSNAEGTVPMVPVDISYAQYSQNEDPVLEAALNFQAGDFKRNPIEYINMLYISGDMNRMIQELPGIVFDPRYSFVDFEEEFSKTGTRMMHLGRQGNLQASVQIFTMVTQFFPESARAWRNLSSVYSKLGDETKSAEFLEKSRSLEK